MKYLRKIVAMLIAVVLFAAVAVSVGVIFSVKNVNVTLLTYADDYSSGYENAKQSLSVFKGESILFVGEEDIAKAVESSNYSLYSYEKIYPCTINVTLKERRETYAVYVGGQYSMYDSDGAYLRKASVNENVNDGAPNVLIEGVAVEELPEIARIASYFKTSFKSLRSTVLSVELDVDPDLGSVHIDRLIFNMRCGLKIVIVDYAVLTEEKIDAAYERYLTLSDREKLGGTLTSYPIEGADGVVGAYYSSK